MGFWHSMSWRTEGIRVTAPVQWRQYDGMVSVLWEAESQAGASGYYLADDPRIMFFFNDVSPNVRISNLDNDLTRNSRPMARAVCSSRYPLVDGQPEGTQLLPPQPAPP